MRNFLEKAREGKEGNARQRNAEQESTHGSSCDRKSCRQEKKELEGKGAWRCKYQRLSSEMQINKAGNKPSESIV